MMEAELEILQEINEQDRVIDEACVELNAEVKTAENEVQERKLREEKACVRGGETHGEHKVKAELQEQSQKGRHLEPGALGINPSSVQ